MSSPSIVTVGLTKKYGSFTALSDLSLKIEGSKCVGFLGPNGAGKTTTLKMLTDMIFPTKGEAFLNGISVQKDRKAALQPCGVLIETPEIYPSLTPREALEMVAHLRGLAPSEWSARITEVLSEVKMVEWADKKVGQFSKGMKQRVNIAASLISNPQVLLLDEPTSGLDPRGVAEVRDIIRGLKRGHRLIFMSSHILSEVSDVCDEVALLNKGNLVFYDTIANVTSRFSGGVSSVDAGFLRPIPDADLNEKVTTLPNVISTERLAADRVRVRLKGGPETQGELLQRLAALNLGLVSYHESANALEEIYMSQVTKGD
jgi:ABC-2 type transport system ATP-binding protein